MVCDDEGEGSLDSSDEGGKVSEEVTCQLKARETRAG